MKKIIFLLFSLFTLNAADIAIVLPPDAVPAEKTAAAELRKYLSRLAKQPVSIISSGNCGAGYTFYLGQTPGIAQKLGISDFRTLKPDEILLRRIGNDFYLTGDRPRGTLYAVYTFLEDICGMRFFAPDETVYPEKFNLPMHLDLRYAPSFIVREVPFPSLRLDSAFAAKRKVNGHWQKTTVEWGGHETILGFCHTFARLMPPEKYGRQHPEYYSEINGIRHPVGNQLCLSNRNMRQELIRNIRKLLREKPSAKIISVSQDDNNDYCRCRECNLLAGRYGNTQSGILIDCLNEIAASLEHEFPGVFFETLAYAYSVKPPENIRPRHNVIVRLCADNCDYGQPLNSPANSNFRDALTTWSKLTNRLMVWNYVSVFGNYLIPNPNWGNHGINLRFFRDHGVIAVFNQAGGNENSDFAPLRAYVNSKLLWNPDLDEKTLIDEFLQGYYGRDAAPLLREYLNLMKIDYAKQKPEFKLSWSTPASEWLSYNTMEQARELMMQAAAVSQGKYAQRVRTAKIAIDFAFLLHPETPRRYAAGREIPQSILDDFIRRTSHDHYYGEGENLDRLKTSLSILYSGRKEKYSRQLPQKIQGIPPERLIIIEPEEITAYENNIRTKRYPDFIRMRADHKSWLIQFPDLAMRTQSQGRWRLFAEMRTGGMPEQEGFAFQAGIYDKASGKNTARRYPLSTVAGKDFQLVDLGCHEFHSTREYFFCAPVGNSQADPIDVKRLFLVKE